MVHGHRFIDLAPISNLRILSASAGGGGWTCPAIDWLSLVVQKSPDLISRVSSARRQTFAPDVMQQEGIRLKQVKVRATDSVLLRYLASYSAGDQCSGTTTTAPRCLGPFKADNIALISEMRRLQILEMSINGFEMRDDPDKGLRNIVDVFLEMAVEMPALRNIAIYKSI
ncbi:hypothetical protein C8R47DRAFT_1079401 [Mycena vitilis]|nr:hypothetical protein C8R47DRAFT_1079401 [Mycena vitilis]